MTQYDTAMTCFHCFIVANAGCQIRRESVNLMRVKIRVTGFAFPVL